MGYHVSEGIGRDHSYRVDLGSNLDRLSETHKDVLSAIEIRPVNRVVRQTILSAALKPENARQDCQLLFGKLRHFLGSTTLEKRLRRIEIGEAPGRTSDCARTGLERLCEIFYVPGITLKPHFPNSHGAFC
ncbi:hypothetical protein CJO79_15335 [Ralstonia solanacearum]|nr:hypothetical protein CJO76_15355 [Ralstonia solanacearum]AXV92259.1 hypothetical protein CJO79_15335 [Ralstonia solanacearum]AXW20331.1 hypothetical protein CJO85_15385 [Ralstonia solanacearum]AXW77148.1 hypothetical protein CJO97_15330 [Ralstonia solanacearum]